MARIEMFFGEFASSECDDSALEGDSLGEIFQGVMTGHAVELIEMNDGEYYVLAIYAHSVQAWNLGDTPFRDVQGRDSTLYRFESLSGALTALERFQSASLRDAAGVAA